VSTGRPCSPRSFHKTLDSITVCGVFTVCLRAKLPFLAWVLPVLGRFLIHIVSIPFSPFHSNRTEFSVRTGCWSKGIAG
jgi:hypothetical protein